MSDIGLTPEMAEGTEFFDSAPASGIGAALDRAVEIVENALPVIYGRDYDWRRDVMYLVTSDAFTVRQASSIVSKSPVYVTPYVRSELGLEKRQGPGSKRTMFGVAGKLNNDSLAGIRTLRSAVHKADGHLDNPARAAMLSLMDEGNGLAVMCHLIGLDVKKVRRALQYYRETKLKGD